MCVSWIPCKRDRFLWVNFLRPQKIHRPQQDLNPRTLDLEAITLPQDHNKVDGLMEDMYIFLMFHFSPFSSSTTFQSSPNTCNFLSLSDHCIKSNSSFHVFIYRPKERFLMYPCWCEIQQGKAVLTLAGVELTITGNCWQRQNPTVSVATNWIPIHRYKWELVLELHCLFVLAQLISRYPILPNVFLHL